jgi:MarR family transcriptional regulator, organic hydroperoxide resistance regulator
MATTRSSKNHKTDSKKRGTPAPRKAEAKKSEARKSKDDGYEDLGEVLEFMQVLWALDHALQSRSKRMEQTLGVTGPQRLVIRAIGRKPAVSAGEVADLMRVHPSTLTGVLRRLEARGFVTRKTDVGDKRRALFRLTAQGEKLDTIKAGTVEAAVRRALKRVSAGAIASTGQTLAAVAEELDRDDA